MKRLTFFTGAAGLILVPTLPGADAGKPSGTAYEQIIAPIFQARCVECHGERKQKAKLALHTWEAFARGSDGGPIVVAGKPENSVLVGRLKLPVADEEHMPPTDRPQPALEEIALVVHWIEQGASRTTTLAELRLPERLEKVAAQLPATLAAVAKAHAHAEPLWEFDPAAVAKGREPLAAAVSALQRRFPGALTYESRTSAALHFTAVGFGREFGDAELAVLEPIREQLVFLDIAGTGLTDRSATVLSGFTRLRVLRAGFTAIGDATIEKLPALTFLESLSLPETAVTAASVGIFTKLRALRSLRVAGTAAERPAQMANLPVVPSAGDLLPAAETGPEVKAP